MKDLVQFVMAGVTVGAIYGLIALGFSIIYKASGVINFSQGEFVMIGGMLAGTAVTPGKVITKENGAKVKQYRGMASREAQTDFMGGMSDWKTAEGVATEVAYREDQDLILADIIGGLRSGLTYAGSSTIRELQRKLDYVMITPAGRIESLPHKTL